MNQKLRDLGLSFSISVAVITCFGIAKQYNASRIHQNRVAVVKHKKTIQKRTHKKSTETKEKQAVQPKLTGEQVQEKLTTAWHNIDTSSTPNIQISIYDHKRNTNYNYVVGANDNYPTASIIKVFILARKLQDGDLSDDEKDLATKMIEDSDNDATTELATTFGGIYQFQPLFDKLQMTNSHANQTWGLTDTTATDQIKLLNDIFYNHAVLNPNQSNYISQLMENIENGQDWGVSTGVPDSAGIELKNGWLPLDDNDGDAIVNSIGHISSSTTDYTIAVLTHGDTNEQKGIETVNNLSQVVYDILSK